MNLSLAKSEKNPLTPYSLIHPKDEERVIDNRKKLFNFSVIISIIFRWQEERPVLLESDKDLRFLIYLILLEVGEVGDARKTEGLPDHNFKDEEGEISDVIFILIIMFRVAIDSGAEVDFKKALLLADGQSVGSGSLDRITGMMSSIDERSIGEDLGHAWTLVISYVIHMRFDLNPTKVLVNYTVPKNEDNYIRELLVGNPHFELFHGRPMNKKETIRYFAHYKDALRIIRDFAEEYINSDVGDSGIGYEFCKPYEIFIYNFFGTDITPTKALLMLKEQLFADYEDEVEAAGGRKEKILIAK